MKVGTFFTPPANQGQIVEVSYTAVGDYVIRRILDQSDGTVKYDISKALARDDGDYWNAAPSNKRWREITAAEVERLIEEEQ